MKIKIAFVLFFGGVLYSAKLAAQQDSVAADVAYVAKNNAWLFSNNAIGLKYFPLSKLSNAQLYLDKRDGDFKNYYQSNNSYRYGLAAESIYRLSPKVVVSGEINYHSFKGSNMAGSAFLDPYQNPFDIVEWDDTNKGTKKSESYKLAGALATQLNSRFSIGGKLNYLAENYAKTRDLRHVNKLLDMKLSLGGAYRLSNMIELGMNYNYFRRIESIYFNTYGNTDRIYNSLINFGSFFGRKELYSRNGYTAENLKRPLKNSTHGASMQLNFTPSSRVKWFNELTYGKRKGYYGENGTATILYTNHESETYQYKGQLSVTGGNIEHHLTLISDYKTLVNKENIFRRQTTAGGVDQIIYYGQSEALDQQQLEASLDYTIYKNVVNYRPKWAFSLKGNYFRRLQRATLFPFYRDQTINSYQASANVKRNIVKSTKMYSIGLGLGYGSGSGLANHDGLYAAPSDTQTAPASMDLYLYQEFEYFTKPRVSADLDLQYTRKLKRNISPYLKLNYSFTKAFDTQFLGGYFGIAGLSIGCIF